MLLPAPVPLGLVTTAYANNSFAMSVRGGSMPASIAVSATAGSATLVYQVDRSNGLITIAPIDITTNTGLAAMTQGLAVGAPVKVYRVLQADGALKAYVLAYYTGVVPASRAKQSGEAGKPRLEKKGVAERSAAPFAFVTAIPLPLARSRL